MKISIVIDTNEKNNDEAMKAILNSLYSCKHCSCHSHAKSDKKLSEQTNCYAFKDLNGKEIYGGDIVRTNSGRLCKVVWISSSQYCGWDLIPVEIKNLDPNPNELWENLEVVGIADSFKAAEKVSRYHNNDECKQCCCHRHTKSEDKSLQYVDTYSVNKNTIPNNEDINNLAFLQATVETAIHLYNEVKEQNGNCGLKIKLEIISIMNTIKKCEYLFSDEYKHTTVSLQAKQEIKKLKQILFALLDLYFSKLNIKESEEKQ